MKIKKIVIILILLLIFITIWYWHSVSQLKYIHEKKGIEYLSYILMIYAEKNQGSIPDSWSELVESEVLPLRISHNNLYIKSIHSKYISFDSERVVYNYQDYKIAFGTKPRGILIKGDVVFETPLNKPLLLIAPPDKSKVDINTYRIFSKEIAQVMLEYTDK